ncbi:MAG: DUF523 domain-containing protein [Eubacteriales bacterium]|nr:DUF523 domain-containing protein [Eubacteriales bacterium]
MKVLVSACLLGVNCKYNGKNNDNPRVAAFLADKEVVAICPEMLAGLGTPRNCAEIVNGRVTDNQGNDVDEAFRKGVALALEKIKGEPIALAILQSRSPTCGVRQIYDGSFSGKLVPGQGLFARELIRKGIRVMDAEEF